MLSNVILLRYLCFGDEIAESAKIRCVHMDGKEFGKIFSYGMIKYVDAILKNPSDMTFPLQVFKMMISFKTGTRFPLTLGATLIIVQYLGYSQLQSFKKWKGISRLGWRKCGTWP